MFVSIIQGPVTGIILVSVPKALFLGVVSQRSHDITCRVFNKL